MLDCLNSGKILKSINLTHIALIPKIKSPECLSQFRPISLCNVLYKIVSKLLSNRLRSIMPLIISDSQSAFVPGRLISDNILVALEMLHSLKNRRRGGSKFMAIKLDMNKAYDQVEWGYLEAIMIKMGFNLQWTSLIMECISSVSYSVLLNGDPKGWIMPKRGLRQGDPLSPFLFLLCAEGLSALLRKAESDRIITGATLSRRGPKILHLFFADDSLLFCKASLRESLALKDILHQYEQASGQKLNKEKTGMFFSSNTEEQLRFSLSNLFGASLNTNIARYLGLPSLVGRAKKRVFEDVKSRVWQKLQGWKGKLLS